jgi:hypothetical protein
MFKWYLRVGLERARLMREMRESGESTGEGPASTSDDGKFIPVTPEEIELGMGMLKAMLG